MATEKLQVSPSGNYRNKGTMLRLMENQKAKREAQLKAEQLKAEQLRTQEPGQYGNTRPIPFVRTRPAVPIERVNQLPPIQSNQPNMSEFIEPSNRRYQKKGKVNKQTSPK